MIPKYCRCGAELIFKDSTCNEAVNPYTGQKYRDMELKCPYKKLFNFSIHDV